MNIQTKFFTAATVTAIAGLVSAAPAQAITFGSGLIQGDGSNVHFSFQESHGAFQSQWGVYNKTTDTFFSLLEEVQGHDGINPWSTDNMGTCGLTVLDCNASFTFEEGNEYSFFLKNTYQGNEGKTIFSANELNPIQPWTTFEGQTKFFSDLSVLDDASYGTNNSLTSDLATAASESVTLKAGMNALIAFEDQGIDTRQDGSGDYFHGDWNDFIVTASVPEPATMLGLGVVAGAMTLSRRRKQDKAS
jgi:hypothetical protein